uniref:Zinc finger BED domain-containing protein RICESLEEPER 2-like n=1 Tax=Tanacetum cinerariifolium TaxID=118510 RepID=A0A6L2JSN6_TANCI|nr:zinc finger BED domain-containing protein RICESLEEPER 2-like [Tanacetum cinerariifolium]
MAWKFDQKESKKALAHMLIVDELPFSFVERKGFRHYSKMNQPLFDVPCRGTTTQDCYKLYDEEKNKLLNVIQKTLVGKNLILDVPTRWNSTYNMLEVAQAYEDVFDIYDLEDAAFGNAILKKSLLVPTHEDWDKARKLCGFLKIFYDVTLRISGTKYVTSHTLIVELSTIRELLRKQILCDGLNIPPEDEILYKIAKIVVDDHYGTEGLVI